MKVYPGQKITEDLYYLGVHEDTLICDYKIHNEFRQVYTNSPPAFGAAVSTPRQNKKRKIGNIIFLIKDYNLFNKGMIIEILEEE